MSKTKLGFSTGKGFIEKVDKAAQSDNATNATKATNADKTDFTNKEVWNSLVGGTVETPAACPFTQGHTYDVIIVNSNNAISLGTITYKFLGNATIWRSPACYPFNYEIGSAINDWYWLEVSNSTNKIQLRSGGNFATGWTLYYREIR